MNGYIGDQNSYYGFLDSNSNEDVPKCHMHNKHQNGCRFCIKYKEFINSKKTDNSNTYNNESEAIENDSISKLNPILRNNITNSEYYKTISGFDTFDEILQEIYKHVDHLEPYCSTNLKPSTIFCCLYKLFMMKLDDDNINLLLGDTTSVYARCCGFLYIRYAFHYERLYKWYKPHLLDIQEFTIDLSKSKTVTLGGYLHSLLIDEKYFTIVLPRLPMKFKQKFVSEILEMEGFRDLKIQNLRNIDKFTLDSNIRYYDGQRWERARVKKVNLKGGLSTIEVSKRDGETEIVDLSSIKLSNDYKNDDSSDRYDRSRHYRGRSRDRDYDPRYEEYRRGERERAVANNRDYSRRPVSFKRSLSHRGNIRY